MKPARRLLSAGLLLLAAAAAAPATDVPYLTGRVTDNAEILGAETRQALGARLKAHEERTGEQVAVLTVPTLGSDSVEEYAAAVFSAWKLGQAGKDNGVLVLVAPRERRMRIEVGYGLEGKLSDILAGRIIRDRMAPRFAAGDYDGGVKAGVEAVLGVLESGELPAAAEGGAAAGGAPAPRKTFFEGPDLGWVERILIGSFIFGIIGLFTVIGVLTPGMGWFLYVFLIPFWAMFPIIVVGVKGALALLVTYLVGFPAAKLIVGSRGWYKKASRDLRASGRAQIGGFTLTSSGGGMTWSSGGSGSSGDSGFSGGGGSSGGGGASGSW